mgnify:CR=1 FL=1
MLLMSTLGSCSPTSKTDCGFIIKGDIVTVTDSLNQEITFDKIPTNVVFLQSSLAEPWLLCEGSIKGICGDFKEYELDSKYGIDESNTVIVGNSAHSPDKAKILACKPDVVFYSPDISTQREVAVGIVEAGYKVCAVKIDNFSDYYRTLSQYSAILTHEEKSHYVIEYGDEVKAKIEAIKIKAKAKQSDAIIFRARSSGYTIFREEADHFALEIFKDLNITNKADITWNAKAFDFSKLLNSNPAYIFYFYMGINTEEAVEKYLDENVRSNPIWEKLSAVKNDRVKILEQKYFHYKPNQNWDKAYEEVYNIVYGE